MTYQIGKPLTLRKLATGKFFRRIRPSGILSHVVMVKGRNSQILKGTIECYSVNEGDMNNVYYLPPNAEISTDFTNKEDW